MLTAMMMFSFTVGAVRVFSLAAALVAAWFRRRLGGVWTPMAGHMS